jgi:hypothetical protein
MCSLLFNSVHLKVYDYIVSESKYHNLNFCTFKATKPVKSQILGQLEAFETTCNTAFQFAWYS